MQRRKFYLPDKIFTRLKDKFQPTSVPDLVLKLQKPKNKIDRELFYGAIFCEGLNKITHKDRYFLREADSEPSDFEVIDRVKYYENMKIFRNDRAPDYFKFQNVMITSYDIQKQTANGNNSLYDIISNHLFTKKLDRSAGDYRDTILLFHFRTHIVGDIDIRELRRKVRSIKQNNFDQIWITSFSSPSFDKVTIAELLHLNGQLTEYPIKII